MYKITRKKAEQILENEYGIVVDNLPANGLSDLISLLKIVRGDGNEKNKMYIEWCIEDVQGMDGYEDLTDNEAREVLKLAKSEHNAEIGINWDILSIWAEHVKGIRKFN